MPNNHSEIPLEVPSLKRPGSFFGGGGSTSGVIKRPPSSHKSGGPGSGGGSVITSLSDLERIERIMT